MSAATPFVISHAFHAPRALLYQAHVDADHLANWLTPDGFTNVHGAMDCTVGGSYHYGWEGPAGMQMWGRQVYREIVPNEKLVFLQSFSDADGNVTRHPMVATWPLEVLATVIFEETEPGRSRVTVSWQPYHSDDAGTTSFELGRMGMEFGFNAAFAKLDAYLAQVQT